MDGQFDLEKDEIFKRIKTNIHQKIIFVNVNSKYKSSRTLENNFINNINIIVNFSSIFLLLLLLLISQCTIVMCLSTGKFFLFFFFFFFLTCSTMNSAILSEIVQGAVSSLIYSDILHHGRHPFIDERHICISFVQIALWLMPWVVKLYLKWNYYPSAESVERKEGKK